MFIQTILPDLEFIVNLGDWPLEFKKPSEGPLPIFSWCGSDETRDIVMPTYDLVKSTLETMNRYFRRFLYSGGIYIHSALTHKATFV